VKPLAKALRLLAALLRVREVITLAIILGVVIFFHVRTLPHTPEAPQPSIFLSGGNIKSLLVGMSSEAILVAGMCIVIVGGAFDISVGSVLGLSGMISVQAMKAGLPMSLSLLLGLLCGAMCGLLNGWLIARLEMSPLIATLGMMMAARGVVFLIVSNYGAPQAGDLPAAFPAIGQAEVFGMRSFYVVVVALAVVLIGDILLRNLRWLRQVYYVGGNAQAAALSGINVPRVRMVTFVICGLMAGLAGIMNAARFGTSTYEAGSGIELPVIAQCVIGGANLAGGQGTILGAFLGVVLVSCIKSGLTQLRMPPDWQYVFVGAALIVLVTIDTMVAKRRKG
jgi:ribose transport system permease protein